MKAGFGNIRSDNKQLFKKLFIVLLCLFVIMVGFGVLMPVLPFYTERMVKAEGIPVSELALHVGLLTSAYPLSQLIPAIFLGKLSDRIGRKPLLVLGLSGFILMQILTAISTTLFALYLARIIGGILTSPVIPVGNAYISDITTHVNRKKALAWSGAALGTGAVAGPALGGILAENNLHFSYHSKHLFVDKFSVPFFFAALLGVVILCITIKKFTEPIKRIKDKTFSVKSKQNIMETFQVLWLLFFVSFILQLGLTTFEGSYSLYAKEELFLNPSIIGVGFLICGLVMAVFQPVITHHTNSGYIQRQMLAGMLLSGISIFLLAFTNNIFLINILIAFMALGMAVVIPNILTAITSYDNGKSGQNLALLSSINGIGQITGPVYGTWIYTKGGQLPFTTMGGLLVVVSTVLILISRLRSVKTQQSNKLSDSNLKEKKKIISIEEQIKVFEN